MCSDGGYQCDGGCGCGQRQRVEGGGWREQLLAEKRERRIIIIQYCPIYHTILCYLKKN